MGRNAGQMEVNSVNSVFILGAGASAHAGVPLMNEFFQVAEDLLWTRAIEAADDQVAFELVLRARAQLQPVLSKARFNVRNLEAVFTAFEMAQLFGELGSLK